MMGAVLMLYIMLPQNNFLILMHYILNRLPFFDVTAEDITKFLTTIDPTHGFNLVNLNLFLLTEKLNLNNNYDLLSSKLPTNHQNLLFF